MAVTLIGETDVAKGSSAFTTLTSPAVADGKLMIAAISTFHGARTFTPQTAGVWTSIGGNGQFNAFWAISSGEPKSHRFNIGGGNSPSALCIMAFDLADIASPYELFELDTGAAGTDVTNQGGIVSSNGSLAIQVVTTGGNRALSAGSGQNEIFDSIQEYGGLGPTLGVYTLAVDAGATGTIIVSNPSAAWSSMLFVLKPSGGGPVTADIPLGLLSVLGLSTSAIGKNTAPLGSIADVGLTPNPMAQLAAPLGSLTPSGLTPNPRALYPAPLGSMSYTGLGPNIGAAATIPIAELVISGFDPLIGMAVTVPLGATLFEGLEPSVGAVSGIPLGSLTAVGFDPQIGQAVEIPLGQITSVGITPDGLSIQLPLGTLTLTGLSPQAVASQETPLGSIQFEGLEFRVDLGGLKIFEATGMYVVKSFNTDGIRLVRDFDAKTIRIIPDFTEGES